MKVGDLVTLGNSVGIIVREYTGIQGVSCRHWWVSWCQYHHEGLAVAQESMLEVISESR